MQIQYGLEERKNDLQAAGLSGETANEIVQAVSEGRRGSAERLLLKQRSMLLNDLHRSQNRLYILDVLIQRMK